MAFVDAIEGTYVDLKSATVEDAEFTLRIRQDPIFEKFLPRINNTVEQQKQWIQKQREKNNDYFFVVWNKNGLPIGTIGLYENDKGQPESGRLALKGDAYENFETAYLLYEFAFHTLGLECLYGIVYADNKRAIRYNQQFGVVTGETCLDENNKRMIHVSISAKNFNYRKAALKKLIYRNKL